MVDYIKSNLHWGIAIMPSVFGGNKLRALFYSRFFDHADLIIPENVVFSGLRNIKVGTSFRVCPYVKIISENGGVISIGKNFFANYNCIISSNGGSITIGDDCLFGPDVNIIDSNHRPLKGKKTRSEPSVSKSILIGNNVWVGAKSVILAGVSIGDNCVIAAGSVVTKSVDPNTLVAGVPAVAKKCLW